MTLTIDIPPISEDSEDKEQNSQFAIKQEANNPTSLTPNPSSSAKQTSIIQSSTNPIPPKSPCCTSNTIIIKSENQDNTTTSGSTTPEDTPSLLYLPSNNSTTLSTSHQVHDPSDSELNRPSTPTTNVNSRPKFRKKRSLTLLSPQNITTRSTCELKRKPSDKIHKTSLLLLSSDSDTHDGPSEEFVEKGGK